MIRRLLKGLGIIKIFYIEKQDRRKGGEIMEKRKIKKAEMVRFL